MSDIPEWAKIAAMEVAHSNWRVSSDLIPIIARALVEAYEKGRVEEHELWSNLVKSGNQGSC